MKKRLIHPDILKKIKTIVGKRSLVVVQHILKYGQITTEDLENYGYKHPPRAIRDVREQGLPLEMFWTKNSKGQKISGYKFGDPQKILNDRLGGRVVFSKEFIRKVIEEQDNKCAICQGKYGNRYLQIDHKIPYEIKGDDSTKRKTRDFMPLCASCNRAKSWSCEHCENWQKTKKEALCKTCYWGNPNNYCHLALEEIRRLEIIWQKEDTSDYEQLKGRAHKRKQTIPDFVKEVIKSIIK